MAANLEARLEWLRLSAKFSQNFTEWCLQSKLLSPAFTPANGTPTLLKPFKVWSRMEQCKLPTCQHGDSANKCTKKALRSPKLKANCIPQHTLEARNRKKNSSFACPKVCLNFRPKKQVRWKSFELQRHLRKGRRVNYCNYPSIRWPGFGRPIFQTLDRRARPTSRH